MSASTAQTSLQRVAQRVGITIWGLAITFVLALMVATAVLLANLRQSALEDKQAQVTYFATGAAAAMNRALLSFDVLLTSTDEILGLSFMHQGWQGSTQSSQLLQSAMRQNLLVRYIALLDSHGATLASSDPSADKLNIDVPEDFFLRVQHQPVAAMLMSAPVVSATSSERVVYVARPMRLGSGTSVFAVAQVPLATLLPVLMQSVDIPGLEVTLEGSTGLLLTWPPLGATAFTTVQPLPPKPTTGWGQRARLSQGSAFVTVQRTMYPDICISASLPAASALKETELVMGGVLLAAVLLVMLVLTAGGVTHTYVVRLHEARQNIGQAKAMLDQALESMVSGFLLLDDQGRIVQWNRRYEQMFPWLYPSLKVGQSFESLLEHTVRHHLPGATAEQCNAWMQHRLTMQQHPSGCNFEQRLPSGQYVQVTERPTPEGWRVVTYHDVTDLRHANLEIEALAFYDPLTGLPNRRLLLDRLGQAIVQIQRTGQMGALLFIDLDQFKVLNDSRGHEVGDLFLQQVARRLQDNVRGSDTVARLGGDEFVVMLTHLPRHEQEAVTQVRQIGEKLVLQMSQPYLLVGHNYRSTCSVGAALFGIENTSAAELLKRADIAMYQVKSRRGNGLCFFDPSMQEAIHQRVRLEADLQVALTEHQFELFYQPQFTLNGCMVGAEALLRWRHPVRGLVQPGDFIAVAEESGLIVTMGLSVLRMACEQLAAWQDDASYRKLQLSVNVSARQFRHQAFVEQVLVVLQETGAPASRLKLELTESLVLDDVQDAIAKMHQLRTKGVRFSMDDFGTGHSSLAYLTQLPLHQLKIDKSFVRHLDHEGEYHTEEVIVQTIIGMARTLDLEVIAEGVETVGQRDALARYGCDLYQGYYYGKPMPVQEFHALARGSAMMQFASA